MKLLTFPTIVSVKIWNKFIIIVLYVLFIVVKWKHTRESEGGVSFDTNDAFFRRVVAAPHRCSYGKSGTHLRRRILVLTIHRVWRILNAFRISTQLLTFNSTTSWVMLCLRVLRLTPIVPKVPASSLCRGLLLSSNPRPMSIVLAPSLTMMESFGMLAWTVLNTAK